MGIERPSRFRLAGIVLCLLAAGCSQSAGRSALPAPGRASAPLTVTVLWPQRSAVASPRFISPSAQNVTLEMGGLLVATMNKPATGGTTTSVTIAYDGHAVLTMKTFDAPNGTGTLLGEVDAVAIITAGKANVVHLAITGIAKTGTLSLRPNQPLVIGDASSGYTILGNWSAKFDVTLRDPDGNIILTDPPVPSLLATRELSAFFSQGSASELNVQPSMPSAYEDVTVQLNNPDGTFLDLPPLKMRAQPIQRLWLQIRPTPRTSWRMAVTIRSDSTTPPVNALALSTCLTCRQPSRA